MNVSWVQNKIIDDKLSPHCPLAACPLSTQLKTRSQ